MADAFLRMCVTRRDQPPVPRTTRHTSQTTPCTLVAKCKTLVQTPTRLTLDNTLDRHTLDRHTLVRVILVKHTHTLGKQTLMVHTLDRPTLARGILDNKLM